MHSYMPYPHPPFGHLLPSGRRRRSSTLRESQTPQTFNSKNSRSHELMTRKNVSYSFRFTEI